MSKDDKKSLPPKIEIVNIPLTEEEDAGLKAQKQKVMECYTKQNAKTDQ